MGAWGWIAKVGKAIVTVIKTVVVWAWEHPGAAAAAALTYEVIRRIAERRRKQGRCGLFEMFLQDMFAPIGDYASTLLLIVSVGRGVYDLFNLPRYPRTVLPPGGRVPIGNPGYWIPGLPLDIIPG